MLKCLVPQAALEFSVIMRATKIHCVIPLFPPIPPLYKTQMLVRAVPSATYVSTIRATYQRRLFHQLTPTTIRARTTNQPTAYTPLQLPATASQSTAPLSHLSPFSTSTSVMASDADYMAFLGKANADLKAGQGPQQGDSTIKTQAVDSSLSLPASLKNVDAYYVSESDEPFEPVLLRWKDASQGNWPSEGTLLLPEPFSPSVRRSLATRLAGLWELGL